MNNIGILDPEGKNINPLNNKPYSDKYKELAKVWRKFPAYENAEKVIQIIKDNNVILIESSTGSGKTVLVPKYALHALNYDKSSKIAITLPKQIIAKSAAEFAALTLDVELGNEIGYQYRGSSSKYKSPNNYLLYATDGTIVARLLKDPELKDFDIVIIDEAHERKVQIDFLLYLLRETLRMRPNFKVIIMSATINVDIFRSYFEGFKFENINISGRTNYPITSIFLKPSEKVPYEGILNEGFEIITNILEKDDPEKIKAAHDILFFITSSNEAFDTCKKLYDMAANENDKCKITCFGNTYCIELYAGMDQHKQLLAQDKELYKKLDTYNRKLIVSTNVAESSLTVEGIKYVIDSGYELKSSYDPALRAKKLDRKLITHAQAKQRMGRAGRTEPGIAYHLYTEDEFNNMEKFPEPDIRGNDISTDCLRLLSLEKIDTEQKLLDVLTQFIEPPRENYIRDAFLLLIQHGLIVNGKITELGKIVSEIGDINTGLCLVYASLYDCKYEMIKIIAVTETIKNNISPLFAYVYNEKQKQLEEKFIAAKSKFKHKYGDHHSLLNLIEMFLEYYDKHHNDLTKMKDWCYKHFLKLDTMQKILKHMKKLKRSVLPILDKINNIMPINEQIKKLPVDDRLLCSLIMAYHLNVGNLTDKNHYRTLTADMRITIDKNSFFFINNKKLPKSIIYNELFIFGKNANLNIVSKRPNKLVNLLAIV